MIPLTRSIYLGCLASLFCATHLDAIMPASAEEIVCSNNSALLGKVVRVRSHDCRQKTKTCWSNFVGVTLLVGEVLEPSFSKIKSGDEVRLAFHVVNGKPMKVTNLSISMNKSGGGTIGFPATGRAITTSEASAYLMGKDLVVSVLPVSSIRTSFGKSADREYAAEIAEPYYAAAFEPTEETWIRALWPTTVCRRWHR